MKHKFNNSIPAIIQWVLIALITGAAFGYIRYWIGYYILIQGVIAGLLVPYIIHKTASGNNELLTEKPFKIALLFFFIFMIGEAVGFGIAQPWFDPLGWTSRVLNGDTYESIFGIFSTGGVTHSIYSEGAKGGFWLLLSIFDIAFMFFFVLISISPKKVKKK